MIIRRNPSITVKGKPVEYTAVTITNDQRHFLREAKSQKAQLNSVHQHDFRKDVKTPIKDKLT